MEAVTQDPPRLRVGIARTTGELEAVARLRYRVWMDETGNRQSAALNHSTKTMADAIDGVATILYLANGDDVIATVRIVRADVGAKSQYAHFYALDGMPEVKREEISFTSNLCIAPKWRGTPAIRHLFDAAYEGLRRQGVWLDFIHCRPALVGLYEILGYRRFGRDVLDTEIGLRVPMALVLDDVDYLTRVQSPLARLAAQFGNDPAHGAWFAARFAEYSEPSCAHVMGADEFWSYVTQRIHVDDHPLLRGLSEAEVKDVVSAGTVLRVQAGGVAVRRGDPSNDMYLVLAGILEVRATTKAGGAPHVIETLGTGQVFGEMSFLSNRPRTADVAAVADAEILLLTRELFERLARTAPAAANRLLMNLSVYLVERVQSTTRALAAAKEQLAAMRSLPV